MAQYEVTARNFSESSENRMHSDDIAQKFGFKGALVPGVAVYGHLTHPLVERFGETWLANSVSDLRLLKPAYDGDRLILSLSEADDQQTVQCKQLDQSILKYNLYLERQLRFYFLYLIEKYLLCL